MIRMGLNPPHSSSRREDMTSLTPPFHYPHQPERFGEEPSRIVHWGSSSWNLAGIAGEESLCSGALTKLGIAGGNSWETWQKQHDTEHQGAEGWKDMGGGAVWWHCWAPGSAMPGAICTLYFSIKQKGNFPHQFRQFELGFCHEKP